MLRFLRRLFVFFLLMAFLVTLGGGTVVAAVLLKPWRFPQSFAFQTPADVKVHSEEVLIQTPDGLNLVGWWALHPDARGRTVVLCHGIGADRRQLLPYMRFLYRAGYNVLAFDWRNHGESEGKWTTYGSDEKQDLKGVFAFLEHRPDLARPRVALLGLSLGASIALLMAADDETPQALVLDSPYADLYQLARERARSRFHLPEYPLIPLGMFLSEVIAGYHHADIRPLRWVDRVTVPTLYIHGQGDRATPLHHTVELFSRTGGPKELWVVPRAGHVAAYQVDPAGYERTVLRFLRRNFG